MFASFQYEVGKKYTLSRFLITYEELIKNFFYIQKKKKKKKEYILLFQEIEQPTQLQILVYFCISRNLFSQFVAFTLWNNNYYLCVYCSYKIIYAFNSFVLKLEKLVCIRYHFVK